MGSVSTGHGSVAAGTAILIKRGRDLTYSLTGTHNATIRIESSGNGGVSWDLIEEATTTAEIAPTTIVNNLAKRMLYRSNCTVYSSGTGTALIKDTTEEVIGVGSSPATTVTVFEKGNDTVKQTYLECNALPISITDDAGVAQYGGVQVYDFPEGVTYIKGAMATGILTAGVTGTVINNYDGDVALGTATATTGATLTGTEADVMPSVAISAGASDKLAPVSAQSVATALTESGARWFDGTTTAKNLFLNFVIDDDASHGASTATFTGTIVINWEMMGDF